MSVIRAEEGCDTAEDLERDTVSKLKLMKKYTGRVPKYQELKEIDVNFLLKRNALMGIPFDHFFLRELGEMRIQDLAKALVFLKGTSHWAKIVRGIIDDIAESTEAKAFKEGLSFVLISDRCVYLFEKEVKSILDAKIFTNLIIQPTVFSDCCRIEYRHFKTVEEIGDLFCKKEGNRLRTVFLQQIWYKLHYPVEFYSAVLSVIVPEDMDYRIFAEGAGQIVRKRREYWVNPSWREEWKELALKHDVMEIVMECYRRHIKFLPIEQKLSDQYNFIPEDGGIRMPINHSVQIPEVMGRPFPRGEFRKLIDVTAQEVCRRFGIEADPQITMNCTRPWADRNIDQDGFGALNKLIGDLLPGKLYLISGKRGMGKTTLLHTMAFHTAKRSGKPVYIFSLDEDYRETALRFMDSRHIRRNGSGLSPSQSRRMKLYLEEINDLQIYLCNTLISFSEIEKVIRREIKEGTVFIDKLQSLDAFVDDKCCRVPCYERQQEIAGHLKRMAEELSISVVVASDLSMWSEQLDPMRPRLGQVGYCSDIEEKADTIISIYRENHFLYDPYFRKKPRSEFTEFLVLKNDAGETGTAYVNLEGYYRNPLGGR